ncbi:PhoX family protein [Paracrocinitomix mangrovi]|uniref:alkaline phosphatase PhoX n=1 Tax=Paracrocinitomix mangrovi TaxID=2862509 RepID=UPI001C8EF2D2|nr:alkaline phosphatase PhoX [Paracrocinitomix mangrovi]UKN01827.1 PhoX family protein [Paracrocinitomix mangrovi]
MKKLAFLIPAMLMLSCGGKNQQDESQITEDTLVKEEIVDTTPLFNSIASNFNSTDLLLPEGFTYTVLFREKHDLVTRADGQKFPAKGKHDLSVFIPSEDDPENKGILYISHETNEPHADLGDGGGATVMDIEKIDGHWKITSEFHHIDFGSVGFTDRNCGGSLGPNGNVFSCEETWGYDNEYFTKRGLKEYDFGNGRPMWQNMGYVVEVDPRERKVVKRHLTMGKLVHEDVAITADGKTCYITDDYDPGVFMKLEMEQANDFDHGQLYAYKQSEDGQSGEWLKLPMDTTSLANCRKIAVEMGATMIVRHEWIEEINGKYYISETGKDYMDWDASISRGGTIPYWVKNSLTDENGQMDDPFGRILEFDPSNNKMVSYLEGGMFSDSLGCFSNPDCNTSVSFGNKTYLVISEDINGYDRGRVDALAEEDRQYYNEVYFLDMSIENPTVEDLLRFAIAPKGAETTGVIFLPDGSMIMNVQHPSPRNPAPFNVSCTVLIEGFKK